MHRGQYIPPDPSKGDDTTVGGYAAVHGRPAALEGRDGCSYSIEILSDALDDLPASAVGRADVRSAPHAPRFGAYFLYVQWSRLGAQRPEGHVESDFLVTADTVEEAERVLGQMQLREAQRVLDTLLRERDGASARRWWSAVDADAADDGHEGPA